MKNIISGMFAISTYHAANLQRHTPDWMTWSEYRINMTWLGFTDIHSGIQSYFVSIGSEYMANDLNKVNIDWLVFNVKRILFQLYPWWR